MQMVKLIPEQGRSRSSRTMSSSYQNEMLDIDNKNYDAFQTTLILGTHRQGEYY